MPSGLSLLPKWSNADVKKSQLQIQQNIEKLPDLYNHALFAETQQKIKNAMYDDLARKNGVRPAEVAPFNSMSVKPKKD